MIIKEIKVKDLLTKSNLPDSDYVINPYIGCTHACRYCYACFMKRFTGHEEEWGTFLDVKCCDKPIDIKKIKGKKVFLSSVTDCYNRYEEKYEITRDILKQLVNSEAHVSISTKSQLILRDLDILKQIKDLKVAMSVNTLNEEFRKAMDKAAPIEERLKTLRTLHDNGIYTILFMSPIFPYLTEWKEIIDKSSDYIDEYWFENLNLRGSYKQEILDYIEEHNPEYISDYHKIFNQRSNAYWEQLALEINEYCDAKHIRYINYFYHSKLVEEKKRKESEKQ